MNRFRLFGLIALGGMCFLSCNVKTTSNNTTNATNVQQFKMSNTAISGWTQNTNSGSFNVVSGEGGLEGLLDGGAGTYTSAGGFVQAMIQDMIGPGGEEIVTYVMQYNDSAEAATTYSEIQSQTTPLDSLTSYPQSVAFGSYQLSGQAYAHFGNFLFWMNLNGFANQTLAFQEATFFLDHYKADMTD